tara:strand:+ start:15 stop:287 length:273 start_codon:yes stop_codon:yes gene_type:complete
MDKSKFKDLKKGSIVEIAYKSAMASTNKHRYIVSSRNLVRKGTVDKITLKNQKNMTGVKSFIYIRKGETRAYMGVGDMGVIMTEVKIIKK